MSQIDDIKTEFETIANAQVGINDFVYDYAWSKNVFATKTYPVLLLHTIREGTTLPQKGGFKRYEITYGVYDDYLEAEKATTDKDVKQANIETLGDQFLQEFDRRSREGTAGDWYRLTGGAEVLPRAEWIENMGDMAVFAYEISFTLQVPDDCTTGTFNY